MKKKNLKFLLLIFCFLLIGCERGEKYNLLNLECKILITRTDGANYQLFDPPLPKINGTFLLRLLESQKNYNSPKKYEFISTDWHDLNLCKPTSGLAEEDGLVYFEFTKNNGRKPSECRLMGFMLGGVNAIPYYADKNKTVLRDDLSDSLTNFYYEDAKESDDFFLKGSGFFDYFNKDHYEGSYYACRLLKIPNI